LHGGKVTVDAEGLVKLDGTYAFVAAILADCGGDLEGVDESLHKCD
jgi:hypothetical protein